MNLSGLDLNLLVVFAALADERSVSRAARRVGLSQPAVSNALARLRQVLNDPLFVRSREGMSPTPRAQRLRAPVAIALEQLRTALAGEPAFDPVRSQRIFRLAMSDYSEWLLLRPLLRRLRRAAPLAGIQVRRLDGLFAVPEGDLRSGALDAAIGPFPDARGLPVEMNAETLFEEGHVVVLRRGHPALKRELTVARFAALDHAAVIFRAEPWGLIDTELASLGHRRRLRFASPHFTAVLEAVACSDLVACAPESLARRFRGLLQLRIRPMPFPLPRFTTRIVWRRHAAEDDALAWLRSLMRPREGLARASFGYTGEKSE